MATRGLVVPAANDFIMLGRLKWSFRHLKHKNLSILWNFIDEWWMNGGDLGWFYLLWRKITNSAFIRVDFGWINNNIKFSLKLVQIEITSTLPSVGWMWISICTRFNSNLILLFIHPYPPSKGWVNSYCTLLWILECTSNISDTLSNIHLYIVYVNNYI